MTSLTHTHSASRPGVDGEGAASQEENGDRGEEEEKRVFVTAGDGGAGRGVRDDPVHEKALVEMHQQGRARHDGNVHQGAHTGVKPDDEERPADQVAQQNDPRADSGQRNSHRRVQGGETLHADHQPAVIAMQNVVDAQRDAKQSDSVCLIRPQPRVHRLFPVQYKRVFSRNCADIASPFFHSRTI